MCLKLIPTPYPPQQAPKATLRPHVGIKLFPKKKKLSGLLLGSRESQHCVQNDSKSALSPLQAPKATLHPHVGINIFPNNYQAWSCDLGTDQPDQQILSSVMSPSLKEKWPMLWAFQWGELNARSNPIAPRGDAGCLEVGN